MTTPNWNQYFMNIALNAATRSKDPSTKVGCVIVDRKNRVVSMGYNGWVVGCNEDYMTNERPLKYYMVIHAEMNAILFADRDRLDNATMYCTHAPCHNCLKHAMQAGITRIIFNDPGPMATRGSKEDKQAIMSLLSSMLHVECHDMDHKDYYTYLKD